MPRHRDRTPRAARRSLPWFLLPLAVALLTAWLYAPAVQNGFTDWDDPAYVLQNPLIHDLSPTGLRAIATNVVEHNYHPLTILSLAVDYQSWKLNPAGYHLTNVALHVLATLAVFWFILLLTESQALAAIASLFFGTHPLHVESVAWVSGRKDLLYGLFYFVACACYVLWVRRDRRVYWVCALAAFLGSLLSKGMAVTLPLSLVAIDLYLRRPWSAKALLDKAAFFALAIAFGLITIAAQGKAVQEFGAFPAYERVLVGFHGLAAYLIRAVAPVGLSAFYPYPAAGRALPIAFFVAPIAAVLLGLGIAKSLKRDRTFAFAGLFFLINVALVLQFIPVGSAIMADRYTYVAYAGLGLGLAWGIERLGRASVARGALPRLLLTLFFAALFAWWGVVARERIRVWKDGVTLWTSVLAEYPALPMAYAQRAWSYQREGNTAQAMADLDRALALDPNDGDALSTRGTLYYAAGDLPRALADLNAAVRARPYSAPVMNNRGTVLLAAGKYDEAIADFTKAIELRPRFADAHLNRALAYGVKKEFARALPDLDRAIAYDPENAKGRLWRGAALTALGDPARAIRDYDAALKIAPGYGDAYFARSAAYETLGRHEEALQDALRAREAGYRVDEAYIASLRSASATK
ncbi:MAG TPA: tetratricopeptide repeat protein [Candidatus Eisenbacteria bacterium]|nr:tetratricopeptide repeat protein [Candidatus Eisenbacteria bacterium]